MVALDLPMIPTNVTMKSSSSLVRKWVCREQEPSVGACEAPAAFQVSRIDDGPEPRAEGQLQKTRIDDQRDSETTRKSESVRLANATRNAGQYQEKNIDDAQPFSRYRLNFVPAIRFRLKPYSDA
jgi:hypothetical protein